MSRLVSCVLLVSFLVLTGGCDDDGKPPPDENGAESREYFEQALVISEDVNDRIRALKTTYPDNYLDVADKALFDMQQTRDSYQEYLDLYTEFIDRTEALDPPEELEQIHEENLSVNRAVNAINIERLEELARANSRVDVEAAFEIDAAFSAAVEAADKVCNEFRDMAVEAKVDWSQPCQLD